MTTLASTASAAAADPFSAAASGRVPRQTLGQEEFLRLITVQLTNQDPLKPTDDTSFMAQMAQFSALEQSSQMARDMAALRSDLHFQSASALLGREVTVHTDSGPVTGIVDSVDSSSGSVRLIIGGKAYSPADVLRVSTPTTPPPPSAPISTDPAPVTAPETEPQS